MPGITTRRRSKTTTRPVSRSGLLNWEPTHHGTINRAGPVSTCRWATRPIPHCGLIAHDRTKPRGLGLPATRRVAREAAHRGLIGRHPTHHGVASRVGPILKTATRPVLRSRLISRESTHHWTVAGPLPASRWATGEATTQPIPHRRLVSHHSAHHRVIRRLEPGRSTVARTRPRGLPRPARRWSTHQATGRPIAHRGLVSRQPAHHWVVRRVGCSRGAATRPLLHCGLVGREPAHHRAVGRVWPRSLSFPSERRSSREVATRSIAHRGLVSRESTHHHVVHRVGRGGRKVASRGAACRGLVSGHPTHDEMVRRPTSVACRGLVGRHPAHHRTIHRTGPGRRDVAAGVCGRRGLARARASGLALRTNRNGTVLVVGRQPAHHGAIGSARRVPGPRNRARRRSIGRVLLFGQATHNWSISPNRRLPADRDPFPVINHRTR
ncbi:hypothetical protein LV79_006167 [Actinokineospora globicatena]|nr:hypothetical protein [Actinokineospora globicatena]